MKVLRCEFEVSILKPPKNEPWKTEKLIINKITKYYTNGFDEFFNSMFGTKESDGFYDEIPKETPVFFTSIKEIKAIDSYYYKQGNICTFKCACFNRSKQNPYQFPKFTTL